MFPNECLTVNTYVLFKRATIIILAVRNSGSQQMHRSFSYQTNKK